jgi:TPR repeat protein
MLANALINWQIPHDYSEARRWCEKAEVRQSPAGEYCLGVICEQGIGVPKDQRAFSTNRQVW